MARYHPYPRRVRRSRPVNWVRRNRGLIAAATSIVLALIAAETVLVTVFLAPTAFMEWLLGVFQATVLAAYLHVLHSAFLASDREAIWHLRGAWGEDNTRSELHRAKRMRLIWGRVDSIHLQAGNLDHLVVTRRGGLVGDRLQMAHRGGDTVDMAQAARRVRTGQRDWPNLC